MNKDTVFVDACRRSPVAFATLCSRGAWKPAKHLELIEENVLRTVKTGGRSIISVSVRHGKSEFCARWFVAWYLINNPSHRVLITTHETTLAVEHAKRVRSIIFEYGPLFGVHVQEGSKAAGNWSTTHGGGVYAVGVGGSPIGRGFNLIVVDDPHRNYADAMSPVARRHVAEWWTGTIQSRFEPGGSAIVICSRWHTRDLTGVLLGKENTPWEELRIPALADSPDDPMGRAKGEAAWPERWPKEELLIAKAATTQQVWLSQYQQTPTDITGGFFDVEEITLNHHFSSQEYVRCWDFAASKDTGDYTVGVLLSRMWDGFGWRYHVEDVRRGQWDAATVRDIFVKTAHNDGRHVPVRVPQDPGQAGKAQAQQMVSLLPGWDVRASRITGSKEVRAQGVASAIGGGLVSVSNGGWVDEFLEELSMFPRGAHDDQVDALSDCYNFFAERGVPSSVPKLRPTKNIRV
jgi:predicted phage terminase large subunit-like protein